MMPATRFDFIVDQGATFSRDLVLKSNPTTVMNLTGVTVSSARLKTSYDAPTATINLSTSITPLTGVIRIGLTAAQTAGLAAQKYVYDIKILLADGVTVVELLTGVFQVRPGV